MINISMKRFYCLPTSTSHALTTRQRRPQLSYDLQILCDHVRSQSIDRVVLAFHDSEAFDGTLLSDLIELIRCLFLGAISISIANSL